MHHTNYDCRVNSDLDQLNNKPIPPISPPFCNMKAPPPPPLNTLQKFPSIFSYIYSINDKLIRTVYILQRLSLQACNDARTTRSLATLVFFPSASLFIGDVLLGYLVSGSFFFVSGLNSLPISIYIVSICL